MIGLFADRALRRRIFLMLVTEFLWGAGMYFVLPATTVPSYLASLHASATTIAVMIVVVVSLPLLLQFFGRGILERFSHKKTGIVIMHAFVIIPYGIIPLIDYLLHGQHPQLLITLIIVFLGVSQASISFITPIWLDMLAQAIPLPIRGSYFGISAGCSAIGGIGGGSALLGLQHWLGPAVYRGAFLATSICFTLSIVAFWFAPIPESAFHHPPEPPLLTRLRTAARACHLRTDFGRLIASNALQTLTAAVVPFLVVFAVSARGLRYPEGIFSTLTLVQAVGAALASVILGGFVDRHGPRWPWVAVTLIIPVVVLLYPLGGMITILLLCTFLVGALTGHWTVAAPAMLELSPEGDKSSFVSIANLIGLPSAVCGPLIIAALIRGAGFPAAFLFALIAGLLACGVALTIRGRKTKNGPDVPEHAVKARTVPTEPS